MPAIAPGQPIAPGLATGNTFPQWGVGGGTPGSSAGWNIVEATTAAQKATYTSQGYLLWFGSKSAAQNFVSSESSAYGSGNPPQLAGLAAIGTFFSSLGETNTWIRVAEVLIGLVLVGVGIAKLTHAVPVATTIAKAVA